MRSRTISLLAAIVIVVLCGAVGGPLSTFDLETVRALTSWRADHPLATGMLVGLTQLGGSVFLLPAAVGVMAFLLLKRRIHAAAWLMATVLGGRGMVELIKWATDRPRPGLDAHPVFVFSQAFPSGHAANSMITYLAIALFALPERWRSTGVAIAVIASLLVGLSRPLLGVHWPTDVLGGWAFGGAWTFACWMLSQRLRSA